MELVVWVTLDRRNFLKSGMLAMGVRALGGPGVWGGEPGPVGDPLPRRAPRPQPGWVGWRPDPHRAPLVVSWGEAGLDRAEFWPQTWGVREGREVPAWYPFDGAVVAEGGQREGLVVALKALPSLLIRVEAHELWDGARGVYSNPMEHGEGWERPARLVHVERDGGVGFEVDCGLRIQGGWNRRPEECPKHSFRLVFHRRYGVPALQSSFLGGSGTSRFETLILRGGCNNTWLHWSGEERRRGEYLRDQWVRETHAAMGHPAARGLFAHVYLNGLYWGLYNVAERPDGRFAAHAWGGTRKDYDARNGDNLLEGDAAAWERMFALVNAGVSDAGLDRVAEHLDLAAFADYMILNLFGANGDWDRASNWYAARARQSGGRFRFLVWDAERTLEGVGDNVLDFDDDQSPPRLFHKLRGSGRFRRMVAERLERHLAPGGALGVAEMVSRYRRLSELLDPAIPAEAARWGGYRVGVHRYKTGPFERYTREAHWRPEVKRLLEDYFVRRGAVFREQMRRVGLA